MLNRVRLLFLSCLLVFPAAVWGQNLLQDPTFLLSWDENLQQDVESPLACGEPWKSPFSSHWQNFGDPASIRNGTQHVPTCPRVGEDREWGSIDYGEPRGRVQFWQTVDVTPGAAYILSGVWAGGTDAGTPMQFGVELREGDQTGTIIGQAGGTEPSFFDWETFSVAGYVETGTQLTVVFFASNSSWGGKGLHVDDLLLEEGGTCTSPASITSITPDYGIRAAGQVVNVQINGSNFVPGDTTAFLQSGATTVPGTNVVVDPSGTFLTCDFDYGASSVGYMDVVVSVLGCPNAILRNGVFVALNGPNVVNGSFEWPFTAGSCPVTPLGAPDWWDAVAFGNYGGVLFRDDNEIYIPTCPPPLGSHYASTKTSNGGGTLRMTQTLAITPSSTYTLSGHFAGGGDNEVQLELLDGNPDEGTVLGSVTVWPGGPGGYDWTPAFVAGTPTGPLITVRWEINNNGSDGAPKAAHADNFKLQECIGDVSLVSMVPGVAVNDVVLNDAAITGTGFSGGTAPQLTLVSADGSVAATDINVSADDTLTCDFDITTLSSGYYKLTILKDGCYAELDTALLVVHATFINGDFDDPSTGDPNDPNCGSLAGGASGWNSIDDWWRDHFMMQPTCPRHLPEPIPAEGYGHYGSMTTGADRAFRDQRAWQTVAVTPYKLYKLGGWFAGGGPNTVTIRLLDGDQNAAEIASTEVYSCPTGCTTYDWMEASVQGRATGDHMTIVWEMTGATDESATHVDGLTFESGCPDPFADADADGDVDQEDFAAMQVCFTGATGTIVPGCECFDATADNVITQADLTLFELCASGPTVLADPACDD